MLKRVVCITVFVITAPDCSRKKENYHGASVPTDSLTFYFEKAKDSAISRQDRLAFNRKALDFLLAQRPDSLFVENLFRVADRYYGMWDMEAYKATTLLIEKEVSRARDSAAMARADVYLGSYYRRKSVIDSAYLCYFKAEKIYIQLEDRENIGKIELNKALLFYNQGDYLRAQIAAFEALNCFQDKRGKDDGRLYQAYNLIGGLFDELKEYEEAIEYHTKALNLAKGGLRPFKASSLNNLGVACRGLHKNKEAIVYFKQALEDKGLYKNDPFVYAMLQDNLAYSQFKLKEYRELPGLFYQALAIRDSLHAIPGIVINTLHLSEYYQDQKDTSKAIGFAEQAYIIAKEKGIDPKDVLRSLKQLKEVNPAKAEVYASEYAAVSDSLRHIEPILPDKMIYAAYDAKDLALQKAALEERNKNRIIGFGALLFGTIVLFLIFYRRATNKMLKFKEAERLANEKIYDLMLSQEKRLKEEVQLEKKRIARELEEDVFNLLFGARNELYNLNTGSAIDDTARDRFFYLYELQKAEKNLQMIRKDLTDKKERSSSFIAIIKALVAEQHDVPHISFYISETLRWEKIDNIIKVNLYRVLEAYFYSINNYVRAKNAYFRIVLKKGTIVHLTIQDDARGLVPEKMSKNPTILGMQSRIEKLGGTFTVEYSDPGMKIEVIIETYKTYNAVSGRSIV